jgi:ABC-type multidrug transport system fused ATPase/permease subunit
MKIHNLFATFRETFSYLTPLRAKFYLLGFITLVSSFLDVISVATMGPFITLITNPEKLQSVYSQFLGDLNFSKNGVVFTVGILVVITNLTASSFRTFLLWYTTQLSNRVGVLISDLVYSNTLHQSYIDSLSKNTSEVISALLNKVTLSVYHFVFPFFILITSIFLVVTMAVFVVYFNPESLLIFFGFLLTYWLISISIRDRVLRNGLLVANAQTKLVKIAQESLGSVRDILIRKNQDFYSKYYASYDVGLRKAQAQNTFLGGAPRYLIEFMSIFLLVFYVLFSLNRNGNTNLIGGLAVIAFSTQRIVPNIQAAFNAWTSIVGNLPAANDVLEFMKMKSGYEPNVALEEIEYTFIDSIRFENVSFKYPNTDSYALRNVSFEIKKGQRVAIVGESGSGKSTVLDLLMGLLKPTSGIIKVDGFSILKMTDWWQSKISHVPQKVFLIDDSFEANIAFGVNSVQIDRNRLKTAVEISELNDLIRHDYSEPIGEDGAYLSGGQKQRIGLARAFYEFTELIVFDEATSALDSITEKKVMMNFRKFHPNATEIFVTHRLSTVRDVDLILEFRRGELIAVGSYEQMCDESDLFRGGMGEANR